MNEEEKFSPKYDLGNQTQSETPQEILEPKDSSECKQAIDFEHYETAKPKRKIIKAKIIL